MADPMDSTAQEPQHHRSTIQFPYGDLNDALSVARVIFEHGGQQGMPDQVAAWADTTPDHGTFRTKVASARIFGLVSVSREFITLTTLGNEILDPRLERKAKVAAFLSVPLYSALFNKYRGKLLPRDYALDNEMSQLGVSPKQANKARQAFQRSAEQAGFFAQGRDRLIVPAGIVPYPAPQSPETQEQPVISQDQEIPPFVSQTAKIIGSSQGFHPFIQGLLDALPAPHTSWQKEKREQWLETARNIFSLIYED